MIKKLVSPSLTELFVDEMKRMIFSGELKPGTALEPVRTLAEESGVSTAVVNAGLAELSDLGLVTIIPRKGTYVADYVDNGNLKTMTEVIEFFHMDVGTDVIKCIAQCRRGIEVTAGISACKNRTEEDLAILKELAVKAGNKTLFNDLPNIYFNFYHKITLASGNMFLPMMLRSFKSLYLMYGKTEITKDNQQWMADYMEKIVECIRNRDEETVAQTLNAQISEWQEWAEKNENTDNENDS